MKTIKAAKTLGTVLGELDAAIKADTVTLPERTAAAMEKLRKAAEGAAALLLDLGQAEFQKSLEEARGKLKQSPETCSKKAPAIVVTGNSSQG